MCDHLLHGRPDGRWIGAIGLHGVGLAAIGDHGSDDLLRTVGP